MDPGSAVTDCIDLLGLGDQPPTCQTTILCQRPEGRGSRRGHVVHVNVIIISPIAGSSILNLNLGSNGGIFEIFVLNLVGAAAGCLLQVHPPRPAAPHTYELREDAWDTLRACRARARLDPTRTIKIPYYCKIWGAAGRRLNHPSSTGLEYTVGTRVRQSASLAGFFFFKKKS